MDRIGWKRIMSIAAILVCCFCFGIIADMDAAEEAFAESGENQFVLMAVDEDGWIIEPEYVSYSEGQTIKDALKATSHTFQGIDQDWVQEIDGHAFNMNRFYDGGAFDLTAPAAAIQKAIVFTWSSEGVYSEDEAYLDLAVKLAGYEDMDPAEKAFRSVKNAYEDAFRDMPAADSTQASALFQAILTAEEAYTEWQAEESCAVTFDITKNGAPVPDAVISVQDDEGTQYLPDKEGKVSLKSGEYTFVADRGMDQVEGTFTIAKGTVAKEISAQLPAAEWFGEIGISAASGASNWAALPLTTSHDGNTITVSVPDDVTNIYPNVSPGETISSAADMKSHRWYADAVKTDGNNLGDESVASNARTWNSVSTSVPNVLTYGLEGREDIRFKVVYKDEDGFIQRQFKNVHIVRSPTLKSLTVSEPSGIVLALNSGETTSFSKAIKDYDVITTADELNVGGKTKRKGTGYGAFAEGYSIEVNGTPQEENGIVTVPVNDNDVIHVTAISGNGQTDAYTITVHKMDGASVTLHKANASVHAHLLNSAGSVILPDEETATTTEFTVAPGTYTWVGTVDDCYHTSAPIEVHQSGAEAQVATPVKEELLKNLYVKTGTQNSAPAYKEANGKPFRWQDHAYTYIVWDNCTAFQCFYEVSETVKTKKGSVVRGSYLRMTDQHTSVAKTTKAITSSLTGNIASAYFVCAGEENNALTFSVEYTEDDVTYYQDYDLDTKRQPIAQGVSLKSVVSGNERAAALTPKDTDETDGFDGIVNEYTTTVPQSAESLKIKVDYSAITVPGDGKFVITVGDHSEQRDKTAGSVEFSVPLNTSEEQEQIEITFNTGNPDNVTNTYLIETVKSPPVKIAFTVTPDDHNLMVMDNTTKETVTPGSDGAFELMEGGSYTYTATAHGYIGQQVADYTVSGPTTIKINLEPAPENDSLNTELQADWPRFRFDDSNNGATDYLTPVEAEKTSLYWANQIGSGYGSGATGCPIIVGDYLYTYAGNKILKVDRYTGKVELTGDMVTNSSFAINSPCYAEGMVFVGLSGGRVQAFNAETLESLWVYTNPLGGQPNCPIAYHDGYIYTGFWNSETKPADFVCMSVTDENPNQPNESKLACWTVTDNGFYWAGAYVGSGAYSNDNTYIVVGTDDGDSGYTAKSGNLLSIDRKTGRVIDRFDSVCKGDIRSSICYDDGKYYFTSKGGYFCCVEINEDGTFKTDSLKSLFLSDSEIYSETIPPMSTSTPCVYNGRAYVGVAGTGQFQNYSGHNITVIDLDSFSIAYTVATMGYPQTSGLLTKGYDDGDGTCYVYFIDNASPGTIRVIQDAPGQTKPVNLEQETYTQNGQTITVDTAYKLWTPFGKQAQYAICSPISDEYGNIYFKNDSAYMMMIGATIDELEVTRQPEKKVYNTGESFDPAGMVVVARYSNGKTRDVTKYIVFRTEPFTEEELGTQPVDLYYSLGENMLTYQNRNGEAGQDYEVPSGVVTVNVKVKHVHEYGQPVYTWSSDLSKCTAKVMCVSNDCDDSRRGEIQETVTSSVSSTVAATCTAKGEKIHQAVFRNLLFAQQSKPETLAALGHKLTTVKAELATDKKTGNTKYWKCAGCGKFFSDAKASEGINKDSWIVKKSTMTVKAMTVKGSAKKKTIIKKGKAFTVKNAPGKVTFKKIAGNKRIIVSKSGKVTVKTGLKKGKTYTVKVRVTSAKTVKYAKISKAVKLKVKITK